MRRLLQPFFRSKLPLLDPRNDASDNEWTVGARYETLRPIILREQPDELSNVLGEVARHDSVLLIKLMELSSVAEKHCVMALLVSTNSSEWLSGWAKVQDGKSPAESNALTCRRLCGSWEAGGRYRVQAEPVLQENDGVDSVEVCQLQPAEEVLLLELDLVYQGQKPRLRGYVRTDTGHLGWLTIEMPGVPPFLEPSNIYREDVPRPSSGARLTLSGAREGSGRIWESGGKYKVLADLTVRQASPLESPVTGKIRIGTLVTVEERVQIPIRDSTTNTDALCLFVAADGYHGEAIRGWICSLSSDGAPLLDTRDHLEYCKLLKQTTTFTHSILEPKPPPLLQPPRPPSMPYPPRSPDGTPPRLALGDGECDIEEDASEEDIDEQELPQIPEMEFGKVDLNKLGPTYGTTVDILARNFSICTPTGRQATGRLSDWELSPKETRAVGENLSPEAAREDCACHSDDVVLCGSFTEKVQVQTGPAQPLSGRGGA